MGCHASRRYSRGRAGTVRRPGARPVREYGAGAPRAAGCQRSQLFGFVLVRQRPVPPSRQEAGGVHIIDLARVHRVAELLVVPWAARLTIQRPEQDRHQASVGVQAGQLLPGMARGRHGIHGDPGDRVRCPLSVPPGSEHLPGGRSTGPIHSGPGSGSATTAAPSPIQPPGSIAVPQRRSLVAPDSSFCTPPPRQLLGVRADHVGGYFALVILAVIAVMAIS